MFEDHSARKRFLSSPPSVPTAVAAMMEPVVACGTLAFCHSLFRHPFGGVSTALMVLLLVLMFPGANRFGQTGVGVLIDTLLLMILASARSVVSLSTARTIASSITWSSPVAPAILPAPRLPPLTIRSASESPWDPPLRDFLPPSALSVIGQA